MCTIVSPREISMEVDLIEVLICTWRWMMCRWTKTAVPPKDGRRECAALSERYIKWFGIFNGFERLSLVSPSSTMSILSLFNSVCLFYWWCHCNYSEVFPMDVLGIIRDKAYERSTMASLGFSAVVRATSKCLRRKSTLSRLSVLFWPVDGEGLFCPDTTLANEWCSGRSCAFWGSAWLSWFTRGGEGFVFLA